MGHRRLAGHLPEQEIAGHGFLRLEIPETDGQAAVTQFYAPAAVYGMTPTTGGERAGHAARNRPEPVHPWELPKARPAATVGATDQGIDEPSDYDEPR